MLTPTRDNFDRTKAIVRKVFGPDKFAVDSDLNEVGQAAEDLFARQLWLLIKEVDSRFTGWTFTGGTNSITVAAGEAAVETYADRAHVLDLASPEVVSGWTTPSGGGRTDYLYVDVEFEQVDPTGDATLINPAVGEETINDIRLAFAFVKQEGGSVPSAPAGHYYVTVATIARSGGVDTIADGDITNNLDNYKTIETPEIEDNSVTLAKMADNSVGNDELVDNAVTLAKMADNSVDTPEIVDDAITEGKLDALSVATAAIQAAAVTLAKMAPDSVDTSQIVDGAVSDAKLQNNHVNTIGDTMTGNLSVPNINIPAGGEVDGIDLSKQEIIIWTDSIGSIGSGEESSNVGAMPIYYSDGNRPKLRVLHFRRAQFDRVRFRCQAKNGTVELRQEINDGGGTQIGQQAVGSSWTDVEIYGAVDGSTEGDRVEFLIQCVGTPGTNCEMQYPQLAMYQSET